ncbi:hypothetical protein QUF50_01845 [Thiotrichales bacterium HSG1]|nr:hypothetical protein [Thiotrichales bacterium HSG1]
MNEIEVDKLLQVGNLTITVDTNILYEIKRFFKICNKINSMSKYNIKMVISSLVHTEKMFDLKQAYGNKFDTDHIIKVLKDKKVVIEPFTEYHAESIAEWIGTQFPTNEEWQKYKRQECINCLGIKGQNYDIPGTGKKCGARVDWLIAGYAYTEDYLLITDDKGKEFEKIKKKTTLGILEKVLTEWKY